MKEPIKISASDRILFVNIKRSFHCTDRHSEYYRPSTYEATRKYWRISKQRLSKISLVVGHIDGIVKEVIAPEKWNLSTDARYPKRYECEGKELKNSPYLGKDASQIITIGQNSVAYYNSD